jgi:TPR repeat protein
LDKDYKTAYKLFLPIAKQGYDKAQLSIAMLYKDGRGITKDSEEAMRLITLAAEGGIPLTQLFLELLLRAKGLEIEKEDYISAHK